MTSRCSGSACRMTDAADPDSAPDNEAAAHKHFGWPRISLSNILSHTSSHPRARTHVQAKRPSGDAAIAVPFYGGRRAHASCRRHGGLSHRQPAGLLFGSLQTLNLVPHLRRRPIPYRCLPDETVCDTFPFITATLDAGSRSALLSDRNVSVRGLTLRLGKRVRLVPE